MSDPEKKERLSADYERDPATPTAPILPTVNPATEKAEAPKSSIHPAFYVMYVMHPTEKASIVII